MNETLEQQIKRLEFCRDCIDQSYNCLLYTSPSPRDA